MKACKKNVDALVKVFTDAGFKQDQHGDLSMTNGKQSLTITIHTEKKNHIWVCSYDQDGMGTDYEMKKFPDVIELARKIKDDHSFKVLAEFHTDKKTGI